MKKIKILLLLCIPFLLSGCFLIYKDFQYSDPEGPWNTIRCIVYENLSKDDIHSIRLQSHLVGPRDWDPYSKAKYLDQLSNVERLPMETIISMCGGKKSEIIKLINAYTDMTKYYFPKINNLGIDFVNVYGATETGFPICAANCNTKSCPI